MKPVRGNEPEGAVHKKAAPPPRTKPGVPAGRGSVARLIDGAIDRSRDVELDEQGPLDAGRDDRNVGYA
jgi:hypothetical protein